MITPLEATSRPLRIGLVGGWGHESVKRYPGAELAWACDADEKARDRAAAGNHPVFSSMDELLREFQPDVVYIGSVFGRNGSLAVAAMEQGLPVVSEKPIAADRPTLNRLRELSSTTNLGVIAEFAMRWCAPLVKARELVASNAIGEITLISASKAYKFGKERPSFYGARATFGGIIPWIAGHSIDYAAWTTGLTFRSVTAQHGNRCFPEYPEMKDHAAMLFEMNNGAACVVTADFLRPSAAASHGDNFLHLTGTQGTVEVRNAEVTLTTATHREQWQIEEDPQEGIRRAVGLVNAAMGKPSEISTKDSLHSTEAALAARESADLRRLNGRHTAVSIPERPEQH